MKKNMLILSLLVLMALTLSSRPEDFSILKGPYLGQKPPGLVPEKFFFDFLPEGYKLHSAPAFMPDGEEVYFSAMDFSIRYSERIFVMKMVGGTWRPPRVAPFSGDFFDGSPSISKDGRYLVYSSGRKSDGNGLNENGERNIWYVERTGEGWSPPKPLSFQTEEWENGSDMSEKGNLFFDAKDIYKIKFPPGEGDNPEKLGNTINSDYTELHPCVAPDERFIVFYSNRPGHYGTAGGDLYISFKNEDGTWKQAVNLGEQFNKGHLSTSFPRLSPDGKYLFFLKLVSMPWQAEVYWVDAKIIDDLKAKEFQSGISVSRQGSGAPNDGDDCGRDCDNRPGDARIEVVGKQDRADIADSVIQYRGE